MNSRHPGNSSVGCTGTHLLATARRWAMPESSHSPEHLSAVAGGTCTARGCSNEKSTLQCCGARDIHCGSGSTAIGARHRDRAA
eukprot:5060854-Prymnesium_polylepis.1